MRQILFVLSIILMASACTIEEKHLYGTWQAVQFYENGQSTKIPLDEVKLVMGENHQYQFQTLGFYSESGRWQCSGNYLVLSDTCSTPPTERLLKVLYQTNDSLKIKMERNGAEQVMFFGKVQ